MKSFSLLFLIIFMPKAWANPACETAGELMSLNLQQNQFADICKKIVNSDPACQKLKAEKRMNCESKSDNLLAINLDNEGDTSSKIYQCIKGFVWDSTAELVTFIGELISNLVGSAVDNKNDILKFLLNPIGRQKLLAESAVKGGEFGAAFLKSSYAYVAQEYPKNLADNPGDPILALGETLAKPVAKFISEAVQGMIEEYVPQYQCMNGPAKLNTICKLAGEFVMPPVFLFTYMKHGIKGIKTLAKSEEVSRFQKNFTLLNEKSSKKSLSHGKKITQHSDNELLLLAKSERAKQIKQKDLSNFYPTVDRLLNSQAFRKQQLVVNMSKAPKIPLKSELRLELPQNVSPRFTPEDQFQNKVSEHLSELLSGLPKDLKEKKEKFYLIIKPEKEEITLISERFTDKELAPIQDNLKRNPALLKLMASQPGSKIARHLKVTLGSNPEIKVLRPDDDVVIFQNVNDQTFEPWAKAQLKSSPTGSFPVSMIDDSGIAMFKSAEKRALVDWKAVESLEPQAYRTFCGLASVCTLAKKDLPGLDQEQLLLNNSLFKKKQEVLGIEGKNTGYELDHLRKVAENSGKITIVVKAIDDEKKGIAKLRKDIISSVKNPSTSMITNFNGVSLGSKTKGHFSPIGAYDPDSDQVLVLDVALHRNESFWIPVDDLYKSMKTRDSFGNPRGYAILHDKPKDYNLDWKSFDELPLVTGLSIEDAVSLKNFIKSSPKDLQEKLLKKFKTQSLDATLEDLETMRDLSKINGKCQ